MHNDDDNDKNDKHNDYNDFSTNIRPLPLIH